MTIPATPASHPRDPLHGITLEKILNQMVQTKVGQASCLSGERSKREQSTPPA